MNPDVKAEIENQVLVEAIELIEKLTDLMVWASGAFTENGEGYEYFEAEYIPTLHGAMAWLEVVQGE